MERRNLHRETNLMLLKSKTAAFVTPLWEVSEQGMLTPVAAKKKADEEEDEQEGQDDWESSEGEEEEWDPDFDEFDVPKSRTGKSDGKEEEDDLNLEEEEEFNDLFEDEGFDEDAAGDDY